MKKHSHYLFIAISLIAYYFMAFDAQRENFQELMFIFIVLFSSFFFFWKKINTTGEIMLWSVAFRLVFLLALPAFSDDYFRFIWDGQLLIHSYNPFNHLPPELMTTDLQRHIPLSAEVYSHINSLQRSNYTCYPPFNQLFFAIAAFFGGNSIFGNMIALRVIIILADVGSIYFGLKILKKLNKPVSAMAIFALNPLVINELTGNLHFEGVMIFFLVVGLYLLLHNKNKISSIFIGLTASVKLLPLILLPLFYKKKGFVFAFISGLVFLMLFSPVFFLSPTGNFYRSILIYFHSFEFNASIFYIFRGLGLWIVGYDLVGIIGPVLALVSLLLILRVSFKSQTNDFVAFTRSLLLCFLIYFSFATTIHPWYIVTLLMLSVFSGNYTPLAWSAVIWLSYYTYRDSTFTENPWLLVIEYTVVYAFLLVEYTNFGKRFFAGI
ncbi:MAG: glycosyltransferase 87 family protein [Paludibacter sp.]|nr:glycosyltransferase 87 family protein [Paludibacter sp.]